MQLKILSEHHTYLATQYLRILSSIYLTILEYKYENIFITIKRHRFNTQVVSLGCKIQIISCSQDSDCFRTNSFTLTTASHVTLAVSCRGAVMKTVFRVPYHTLSSASNINMEALHPVHYLMLLVHNFLCLSLQFTPNSSSDYLWSSCQNKRWWNSHKAATCYNCYNDGTHFVMMVCILQW